MSDERDLEALGTHVSTQQEPLVAQLQRDMEQRFASNQAPVATPRRPRALALLAAAALVCLLLGLWLTRPGPTAVQEPPSHQLTAGRWHQTTQSPQTLRFEDGSSLVAQPRTLVQATTVHDHGASIQLEDGELDVSIPHRRKTRWSFLAGPYEIEVTGTRFRLAWSAETQTLELDMHEGSVVLRGPQLSEHRLSAGDSVRLSPPVPPTTTVEPESVEESDASVPDDPEATEPTPEVRQPSPRRRPKPRPKKKKPTWRELSRESRYTEALEAAEREGFETLCTRLPVLELYELADMARFARATPEAKHAYEMIRTRFPKHELSSRAAFDLGVLSEDRVAVDWFEAYLREQPGGPLARAALGRILELHVQAKDRARARHAARLYLERYPRGPHAKLAKSYSE